MKQKNVFWTVVCVLSAGLTVFSLSLLVSGLDRADMTRLMIGGGALLVCTVLYAVFLHRAMLAVDRKRGSRLLPVLAVAGVLAVAALPVGFWRFTVAVVALCAITAAGLWFTAERGRVKRSLALVLCGALLGGIVSLPFYGAQRLSIRRRETTAPLAAFDGGSVYPHGEQAKTLYVTREPLSGETALLAKTLQAQLCRQAGRQLFFINEFQLDFDDAAMSETRLDAIRRYYPETEIIYCDTFDEMLDLTADGVSSYILYDRDDDASAICAANLAYELNAVLLTEDQAKTLAPRFGWSQAADATGMSEADFLASDYFAHKDKSLLFGFSDGSLTGNAMRELVDYAILSNAWIFGSRVTLAEKERHYALADRNFTYVGGFDGVSENGNCGAAARWGGTYVYANSGENLSVLSGFRPENAVNTGAVTAQGTLVKQTAAPTEGRGKHTVCIMLSDGDNMRFNLENEYVGEGFFSAPEKPADWAETYGISGVACEIAPILAMLYYDNKLPTEDVAMQLSSNGYTYPSKWTDGAAFDAMLAETNAAMKRSGNTVMELIDNNEWCNALSLPCVFTGMRPIFDRYTALDSVDGLLYIGFMGLYAGYHGRMLFSNGKPVVSARYSVWNAESTSLATEQNDVQAIADAINAASTDETSEDAYSFIIVHAWSGLDENGKLADDGDNGAALRKLCSLFDEDVEVVGATEFIRRITENVPHGE